MCTFYNIDLSAVDKKLLLLILFLVKCFPIGMCISHHSNVKFIIQAIIVPLTDAPIIADMQLQNQ